MTRCFGSVLVALAWNVAAALSFAAETAPPWAAWPKEITADVGELQVRFESRSFWTLYRVDYLGVRIGLDRWGSHYGTTINFPGVGFIGSGHTENEKEQLLDVQLWIDGAAVSKPPTAVRCREIRLHKRSQIRTFTLSTDVRVADGRIWEEVRLRASQPTPVSMIYHFMHPWTQTGTEFCGAGSDGAAIAGVFSGDKKQKVDRATRWSAVYDGPSGKGALVYVLAADSDFRTRYWDVPDRYRKHYFVTFLGATVPAEREFCYRIVCAPFAAPAASWREKAAQVADALRPRE